MFEIMRLSPIRSLIRMPNHLSPRAKSILEAVEKLQSAWAGQTITASA